MNISTSSLEIACFKIDLNLIFKLCPKTLKLLKNHEFENEENLHKIAPPKLKNFLILKKGPSFYKY